MLQRVVPLLSFVAVGRHYTSNICRSHQISEQRWIAGWEAASATRSISWLGRTDGRDDLAAGLRINVIYVQHVLTICGWWSPMITMFQVGWKPPAAYVLACLYGMNSLWGICLRFSTCWSETRPIYTYIGIYIYICVCVYLLGMHIRWTWLSQIIWVVMQGIRANTLYSPNSKPKNHKHIFRNGWRDAIMSCALEIARSLLRLENHDTDLSSKNSCWFNSLRWSRSRCLGHQCVSTIRPREDRGLEGVLADGLCMWCSCSCFWKDSHSVR